MKAINYPASKYGNKILHQLFNFSGDWAVLKLLNARFADCLVAKFHTDI
jgi:hypothetical protein